MKYFIFVALLLCGCSQTTVHLYSRYLSAPQIDAFNKELVAADFTVKPNQLKFPRSVKGSSLTYSPLIEDRNAVNNVVNAMSYIEWDIQHTRMLFTDNHWYKENSIALMLVPLGVDPQAITNQQKWVNEYISQNCEKKLIINLDQNGQYQILTSKNQPLEHHIAEGEWSISQFPYLEFRPKGADWGFYFELESTLGSDQIGQIRITELNQINQQADSTPKCITSKQL